VLIGLLLFHGVAEELVWRGFAFGHLRRKFTFRRAVAGSMPLIAITHLPIVIGSGALVGGLAMTTAAITCLPLANLYERGGRTIWAAAILHGLIGTWQLFERSYPPSFQLVILAATMVVPLAVMSLPHPSAHRSDPVPVIDRVDTRRLGRTSPARPKDRGANDDPVTAPRLGDRPPAADRGSRPAEHAPDPTTGGPRARRSFAVSRIMPARTRTD
jgi:hypothetical protein